MERLLFVVEDELHCENVGRFDERSAAIAELHRLAAIPWDQNPNRVPCTSWRECGRNYELVEYEIGSGPWKLLGRTFAFEVSAEGVRWNAAGSRAFAGGGNE